MPDRRKNLAGSLGAVKASSAIAQRGIERTIAMGNCIVVVQFDLPKRAQEQAIARVQQEQAYERSLLPDPEQVRLNDMRRSLARTRRNPPSHSSKDNRRCSANAS